MGIRVARVAKVSEAARVARVPWVSRAARNAWVPKVAKAVTDIRDFGMTRVARVVYNF